MTHSERFNVAVLSVVIALSSATMLWLFWRFPIPTCIGSIVFLGCLLNCVRFASLMDQAASGPTDTFEFAGSPLPPAGASRATIDAHQSHRREIRLDRLPTPTQHRP